ncbi:MAG: hypothetical protein AAGD01_03130 [Acidobacteriota bacterium]
MNHRSQSSLLLSLKCSLSRVASGWKIPRREFPMALLVLTTSLCAGVPSASADELLKPRQSLEALTFRTASSAGDYVRLDRRGEALYAFCGAGEVRVLSRAMLPPGVDQARYVLALEIDGEAPAQERAYRVDRVASGSFGDGLGSGALRRSPFRVERGCHTLRVGLPRSSGGSVALRVLLDDREARSRRWEPLEALGGSPRQLVVRGSRTPYRLFSGDERLEATVEGPARVRLLIRPTEQRSEMSYRVTIFRDGKPFRSYLLDGKPSRRARIEGADLVPVGEANELVFALPAGQHRLAVETSEGLGWLARAQVVSGGPGRSAHSEAPRWSGRARASAYYDSNILRYSDRFIRRFDAGQDPGRFRVESLDDVVVRGDLDLHRHFSGFGGREARIGLDLTHRAYQRNGIKDWSQIAAHWRQELGAGRDLELRLSQLPDFYVRHLRDSDLTGNIGVDPFQAFEFEKSEARLIYRHSAGAAFDLRYHLGLAQFEHSSAFQEFDSDNLFAGVRLDQHLRRGLRLSYAVEFTDSDAQGFDEPGETRATSDDTDPSYRQVDLMVASRFRLSGERRSTLFLQAEYSIRDYTTDKPSSRAPLHAGREDKQIRLFASWTLSLNDRLDLIAYGQWRDRSSSAPVRLDIGVQKDFEAYEIGARLATRFGG